MAASGLVSASGASANATQVIADCNTNGYLTGHYSRADLQSALNGMGADVREYTNCYDVISRALAGVAAAGAGKGGGGGSSGGGTGGTGRGAKGRLAAVSTRGVYSRTPRAAGAGPGSKAPVKLSGSAVSPGAGISGGSNGRSLPTALIVVLVAFGLAVAGGGGVALRRRLGSGGGGSLLRRLAARGGG